MTANRGVSLCKVGEEALRSNRDIRDPAIEGLVDVLRQIHAARTAGRTGGATTAAPADGDGLAAAAFERQGPAGPASLPDALGELLARATRLDVPLRPEAQGAALYETLQERIGQSEAAILAHHAAIDRMLRRTGNGSEAAVRPALVQETVYLQCARGGRTAGRFRCINRADAAVRARVRPGAITAPERGRVKGAAIKVSPRACALGPGEAAIITVALDLQRCAAVAGARLESCIDVELDGACTLKVWVAVYLYDSAT